MDEDKHAIRLTAPSAPHWTPECSGATRTCELTPDRRSAEDDATVGAGSPVAVENRPPQCAAPVVPLAQSLASGRCSASAIRQRSKRADQSELRYEQLHMPADRVGTRSARPRPAVR